MNTRAKAKKNIEMKEQLSDLGTYVKNMEFLKRQLESKEKLNAELMEEQESNSKEFEKMCKQLSSLKKRICEEEIKSSEFQMTIDTLKQENKELILEQEECGNPIKITELNKKLEAKSDELIELQLKYSDLLLQSINSSSIKKGFNAILKRKQINRNLTMKKKQRKNLHKINVLNTK